MDHRILQNHHPGKSEYYMATSYGNTQRGYRCEVADWLYWAGCRTMSYAPESGSPEELKRIKKKVDLEKMLVSIRAVKSRGIKVKANIIFGLPGSNWKNVRETFIFILRLSWNGVDNVGCFSFSPYPGSELFRDLIRDKKISLNNDYFRSQSSFSNFQKTTSYSKKFTDKQLGYLNFLGMLLFYGSNLLFHPSRVWQFFSALFVNNDSTALSRALANFKRRKMALKMLMESGAETIQLPASFRPKTKKITK